MISTYTIENIEQIKNDLMSRLIDKATTSTFMVNEGFNQSEENVALSILVILNSCFNNIRLFDNEQKENLCETFIKVLNK